MRDRDKAVPWRPAQFALPDRANERSARSNTSPSAVEASMARISAEVTADAIERHERLSGPRNLAGVGKPSPEEQPIDLPDLRVQVVRRGLDELRNWRERYGEYTELAEIHVAIGAALSKSAAE